MKYIVYFILSLASSFKYNPMRLSHLIPVQNDYINTKYNNYINTKYNNYDHNATLDIWNDGEVSWLDIVR